MNRRHAIAIAAASLAAPFAARAQEAWPTRPVTLLVPFAAGGSNDVVARLIAPVLEARLGQPFVVENRPGGGGSLGMGMVARGRPDGSVFLISSASNHVFHPLVSGDLGYDPREALPAIAMLVDVPNVLAAHPGFGVTNVQELIAKVRATRGGVSFASSGVGTSNHLAGELFRLRTGIDLTHVPYRGGGPAIQDLAAGNINTVFVTVASAAPQLMSGQITGLGVMSNERMRSHPTIPTFREQGIDLVAEHWWGLLAPARTPDAVVQKIAAAMPGVLAGPGMAERLEALAVIPKPDGPGPFGERIRQDIARYGEIARSRGITAQ